VSGGSSGFVLHLQVLDLPGQFFLSGPDDHQQKREVVRNAEQTGTLWFPNRANGATVIKALDEIERRGVPLRQLHLNF
jgi:hypothetical protein